MALINGMKFLNLRLFVIDRFGAAAWTRIMRSLTAEERACVEAVEPVGWYDIKLSMKLTDRVCSSFDDDAYALMQELGRFEADREFATVHRWVLPLIEPQLAIQNMNVYWRRSNDTGTWTSRVDGRRVTACLRDWAAVGSANCYRVLGYLCRTLQLFGARVEAPTHTECRVRGDPECVFRADIQLPDGTLRQGYRVALEDIPAIGRELAQCPGGQALADTLLTLFRTHLGYQRVAIWRHQGADAPMQQLLGAAGAVRGATVRQYVLEHGGRVVGQLELGVPRLESGAGDEHVLRELLPWVAVVVDRLAPEAASGPREADRFSARLARYRQRWRLTPRQCDVLALLVQGRTNSEIADVLCCRQGTVELHVHSLLDKCGAENRAMLTALFWSEGQEPA
jgi:DNA-binding CsgD family transcriptional regulator